MTQAQNVVETIRIANPYVCLGPVSNKKFFFDREHELSDAVVVCEQILRGNTGGVLITGGRGSGKTSFLEALQRKMTERRIANALIPLNEGLVKPGNELSFIKTILSELLKATEQTNLLEKGLVDRLRGFLAGIVAETDKGVEVPGFSFIVKSGESKQLEPRVPYVVLRDGLADLVELLETKGREGVRRGAMIVFDEGDALTLNKDLIQILRNVFQRFPRIGLIIAGSTRLLEQINVVFSPIPRFFRKIDLGPYPNDETVDDAISVPLDDARKDLSNQGINIEVDYKGFALRVKTSSGRIPMDINLLCHFAWDQGALHLRTYQGKRVLGMFIDKRVMDEAIGQLRGTKEYDSFIDGLLDLEAHFLRLLSKSVYRESLEEITSHLILDELGNRLQNLPSDEIGRSVLDSKKRKPDVQALVDSIRNKSEKLGFSVLRSSLTSTILYEIEDQWIKSYYKYGWKYRDVDLELGMKPEFNGIRVFGDPISTIIHSALFPRMTEWLGGGTDTFRAHNGQNDGSRLTPARNRLIVGIRFVRSADKITYHLAFQMKDDADFDFWESQMSTIASWMNKAALVDSYRPFHKLSR